MFNRGQIVKIKSFDKLPENMRNPGIGKLAGREAEIIIPLRDEYGNELYQVLVNGNTAPSSELFPADALEEDSYDIEFTVRYNKSEKVVESYVYIDDNEYTSAYGRVGGDAIADILQAASYAMKKCWLNSDPDAFGG